MNAISGTKIQAGGGDFVLERKANLKPGTNEIVLLSVTDGLIVSTHILYIISI